MSSFQKLHRIEKLPTLLEFYGYVYFFPGFLAGPAILISDYLSFINGSMFKVRGSYNSFCCVGLEKEGSGQSGSVCHTRDICAGRVRINHTRIFNL